LVNLLITMRCNRACSYCFAKEKLQEYSTTNRVLDITLDDVNKVLTFLTKSNCNALQLAGGEPTLHPKFEEILLTLVNKRISINVLSNATWDPELNALFAQISPLSLGFLLNIDHPKTYRSSEWETVETNLSALKERGNVTLSFNIFEKKPDYQYIFDLTSKYNLKTLRLSFSMPVNYGNKKNVYLKIEEYKPTANYVIDFVKKAEALGAQVGMDNTVPICMFTPRQLSELLTKRVLDPSKNFVCKPAIDIGPDLSIWRCFGTSRLFNHHLLDFNSIEEIYDYYQRVSRLYQLKFFSLKECQNCTYAQQRLCQGGCIGFAEAKCEELGLTVQEPTNEELLKTKFKISEKVTQHRYNLPEEITVFHFQDGGEMIVSPSMADLLNLLDGKNTLGEAIAKKICSPDTKDENDSFDNLLIELSSQQILPAIRRLIDGEVLVNEKDSKRT
jgi:MoaA/NifB/PqqE/SkfB family radical SAM enzyme